MIHCRSLFKTAKFVFGNYRQVMSLLLSLLTEPLQPDSRRRAFWENPRETLQKEEKHNNIPPTIFNNICHILAVHFEVWKVHEFAMKKCLMTKQHKLTLNRTNSYVKPISSPSHSNKYHRTKRWKMADQKWAFLPKTNCEIAKREKIGNFCGVRGNRKETMMIVWALSCGGDLAETSENINLFGKQPICLRKQQIWDKI